MIELRAKFEALIAEWRNRESENSRYSHEYYSGKSSAYGLCADELEEALQAAHASRDAEVEAMKRDADKWRHVRDNQGNGLRIIQWDSKAIEELQVMFPSPALSNQLADAAMAKESPK